jgi:hypothetical protein
MITWFRDLIFGKNYVEKNNSQITDAVTTVSAKKRVTKKSPVKKTTTKKTTSTKKTVSTKKKPVNRGKK